MTASSTKGGGALPTGLMASWGVGSLGTTSLLYLINMFVVFFLVRHVGIPAAVAGTLLAVTRLYDALIDPAIGSLSDRNVSRWGRRRPWMLAGTLLAPLGCIAVFNLPAAPPGALLYTVTLAALLLYCTGYSLFSIPHVAQGAEMTDDYRARAALMAWRTFFVYASGLVITAGAPAMIAQLGGDRRAYATMSLVAGAIIAATMLWAVVFTGRARVTERSAQVLRPLESLRTALANKPFLIILLVKMAGQLGTAFTGAVMLFFFVDVLQRGENALALLGLVANIVGVAAVPLWNIVLRSIERRSLLLLLLATNAATYLSWLVATPAEPQWLFLLRALSLGACGSGSVLVAMAMLTDTIELDRLKTGQGREGLFVGAFELMQTTSFIVAPLIAGFALSTAGLVPGQVAPGAQPQTALQMMRIAMSVIPASCTLLGALLLLRYRLTGATLAALRAEQALPTVLPSMNASASRAV